MRGERLNFISRWRWRLKGVRVNQYTKIVGHPTIGRGSRLCDFVFILGDCKIGKCCDIQPGTVVWGGGELQIDDYVSIGPNSTILTGEYLYQDGGRPLRMVDRAMPHKAVYGKTWIQPDVYVGAGAIIRQGLTISQGAIIGAGSFVNRSVPAWTIVAGTPAN